MPIFSKFFHLEIDPFGETPNPDFYYPSPTHANALRILSEGVRSGRGFMLLTADVGMGKTLTSRILLQSLQRDCNTALILYPRFNARELLQTICEEFEVPNLSNEPKSSKAYLDLLNEFLLQSAKAGRPSVLIVDEAQSMPIEALEALRLVSNLETRARKLLHIVLVAQPEFERKLQVPEIRQLTQRISIQLKLEPLTVSQTERYLKFRLETAGSGNYIRYDPQAITLLHELSGGAPRKINQLAGILLDCAQTARVRLIDANFVMNALELPDVSFLRRIARTLFIKRGSA